VVGGGYSLGACHAYPEPVGAAGYNRVSEQVAEPLIAAADVAASAELGDGRHVWLFGDTLRADGSPAVRNTMLLVGAGCRAVVRAPDGGAAIPDRNDGVGYWPMALITERMRGATTLTVTAERVRGEESGFAFTNLGPALATFVIPDEGAPRLRSVRDLGPDDPSRTTVAWGAAAAQEGEWAYLYGTSNPERPLVFGWAVRVARAPVAEVGDRRSWSYWDGTGWSDDESRAREVIGAVGGVSQTFSVFERSGRWYALSKRDGHLGDELAVWPAPSPWGPFGDPVTVGTIPNSPDQRTLLRYLPLAHPEVLQAGPATVVVSISRNTEDVRRLVRNPRDYRPYFVDVEIPPQPSRSPLMGPEPS